MLKYNGNNVILAKNLRKKSTPQEKRIWYDFLSVYEVRFQRQKPIGNFIADFYCHRAKLVIEIDGSQHYEPQGMTYDAERSAFLSSLGLEVLRFSNRDIDRNFYGVCTQIDDIIQQRLQGPLWWTPR